MNTEVNLSISKPRPPPFEESDVVGHPNTCKSKKTQLTQLTLAFVIEKQTGMQPRNAATFQKPNGTQGRFSDSSKHSGAQGRGVHPAQRSLPSWLIVPCIKHAMMPMPLSFPINDQLSHCQKLLLGHVCSRTFVCTIDIVILIQMVNVC